MKKSHIVVLAAGVCTLGILIGLGVRKFPQLGVLPEKEVQEQKIGTWEHKIPEPAKSKLHNTKQCWLCGDSNRSLMGYFRKFDDVGIICVNNWYVLNVQVRNHDDSGNLTGTEGGSRSAGTGTGEDGCYFDSQQNSDRGISRIRIENSSEFDVKAVQKNLCQTCLDKLLEVMEVYGDEETEPQDLCLVDFQTLELYPIQAHNIAYYVRDYYIQIDCRDEETEVLAVYAPVLQNGKKEGE